MAFGWPLATKKRRAAVLPDDAAVANDHAAAPVEICALKHACTAPLLVGCREEDRVTMLVSMRPFERPLVVDGLSFLLKPGWVKKAGRVAVGEIRVGDTLAIEERLFHGFNQKMVARCA